MAYPSLTWKVTAGAGDARSYRLDPERRTRGAGARREDADVAGPWSRSRWRPRIRPLTHLHELSEGPERRHNRCEELGARAAWYRRRPGPRGLRGPKRPPIRWRSSPTRCARRTHWARVVAGITAVHCGSAVGTDGCGREAARGGRARGQRPRTGWAPARVHVTAVDRTQLSEPGHHGPVLAAARSSGRFSRPWCGSYGRNAIGRTSGGGNHAKAGCGWCRHGVWVGGREAADLHRHGGGDDGVGRREPSRRRRRRSGERPLPDAAGRL